jgi:hypothetical protein
MYAALAAGSMFAVAAMAQEDHTIMFDKAVPQLRVMSLQGSIMGKTVKGAPYSGVEISESTQMLADGTRIHNESQTQVYRDSEGRMRRETANEITIWDPVANTSWLLNPKNQTARKLPMGNFVYSATSRSGDLSTFSVRTAAPGEGFNVRADREPRMVAIEEKMVELKHMAEVRNTEARMKSEIEKGVRVSGTPGTLVAPGPDVIRRSVVIRDKVNSESLGKKTIEGVTAEGTRMVATIEAGAIGNDRPLQTITERWVSQDLQTLMSTRTTDPRTGEEVFKLVNVSRAEPAAYLFQVPAGYQVVESK